MLWVRDGELEDPTQARVAHAVTAFELCRLASRDIIRKAGKAFHTEGVLDEWGPA